MSSTQSQEDVASLGKERSMDAHEQDVSTAATCAPQQQAPTTQYHHSPDVYVAVDVLDGARSSKKRRRTRRGMKESKSRTYGAAGASPKQPQRRRNILTDSREALEENGLVDDVKNALMMTREDVGEVSGNEEPGFNPCLTSYSLRKRGKDKGGRGDVSDWKRKNLSATGNVSTSEKIEASTPSVPSQAVHTYGIDIVCPEDEVPFELCPFSSDGSVEPTNVVESLPRAFQNTQKGSPLAISTTPKPPAPISPGGPVTPTDAASITPASMTVKDLVTQIAVKRTMGRRRRRKKLSYSSTRNKAATKTTQEQNNGPASPALVDTLSISGNEYSLENGAEVEGESNAPPSPVYPDTEASHLYPSKSVGVPWQWEDVDPYFGPLGQNDLDNLMRWRKENANFIAANPKAWRRVSGMESKRALLETMVADATDVSTAHVEFPIRRGRSYLDVWEESAFLDQQKCDGFVDETRVVKMKKKPRGVIRTETSLLVSHRDLVYGYDDDQFQEFRNHLACRVKAFQSELPPTLSLRRQNNAIMDGSAAQTVAEEAEFDEEVLPSFPTRQLHPASLGLWKLRKKQERDYSIVHPASVSRLQVPARWKEEMEHHHHQQYELQLQQMNQLADSRDDDGTGDSTGDRLCATISNHQVTGELPSFGNIVEEDEISQTLAASIRRLIPLSIYNWRTAQLVYERAACSIQCVPILEGEAAAAQELEGLFLQLCTPNDTSADGDVLPDSGPTRLPRTSQIKSTPHDIIAHSVRHDVANNCSLAVAASVEFALKLSVGDVVDVLDRNGCWNYGEVVETYSEDTLEVAKFSLIRFSLWPEDTVEWIAASEGRILPQGVADGSQSSSVGPTRAHRVRIRYDQSLARELELSFPQRQAKQATAASQMLAQRQSNIVIRTSSDLQKTPQKRRRKRPAKSAVVATLS